MFVTLPHFHYPVVEPPTHVESFASTASNIHSNRTKKNNDENNKRRKKIVPNGETTTQTPGCVLYIERVYYLYTIASRQLCSTITNSNKSVQSCLRRFFRDCVHIFVMSVTVWPPPSDGGLTSNIHISYFSIFFASLFSFLWL